MDNEYDQLHELMAKHNLLSLFEHLTFRQKVAKVMAGLKADKESGDYKYARLQIQRLSAPFSAILVPVVAIGLMSLLASLAPQRSPSVQVEIVEEIEPETLEEIEDIDDEPIEPPEPIEMDNFTPDAPITEVTDVMNAPTTEVSPQPAAFDAVALVKSPVIMRGIVGNRTPGMRGQAMGQYGGSGLTEGAVLRALRWLKKNQNPDGSWNKNKTAMTSLALLTFLAHGETPSSEEFGETVQNAIKHIVGAQNADGHFAGRDGHDYTQPIAAYALCEAYALTKIPVVKEAAERAILPVLQGQNPSGGFNYNLKPTDRDDTSYMGWCAQALKAAKMAGIDAPNIQEVMKKAVVGFQKNAHPEGGFGYTGPGKSHGLTGVGVLCMQLLGAANKSECKNGLAAMEAATFDWNPEGNGVMNKNYYWYYITQAKFHHGGATWDDWNRKFAVTLVKNQTIIKDAIEGPTGELEDIGWWDIPEKLSGHTGGNAEVMNTCLCALQLQVYYRYLPTFKTPKAIEEEEELISDAEEIEVNITI